MVYKVRHHLFAAIGLLMCVCATCDTWIGALAQNSQLLSQLPHSNSPTFRHAVVALAVCHTWHTSRATRGLQAPSTSMARAPSTTAHSYSGKPQCKLWNRCRVLQLPAIQTATTCAEVGFVKVDRQSSSSMLAAACLTHATLHIHLRLRCPRARGRCK